MLTNWGKTVCITEQYVRSNTDKLQHHTLSGMCSGLGEWWLHKGIINL